jgi:hypothetical protein
MALVRMAFRLIFSLICVVSLHGRTLVGALLFAAGCHKRDCSASEGLTNTNVNPFIISAADGGVNPKVDLLVVVDLRVEKAGFASHLVLQQVKAV